MVQLAIFLALAAVASVNSAPLTIEKRIAQVISDSTTKWEQACLAAGGGLQCNPISVTAFTTLLAAAGPCEQQDAADSMIDLAKTLKNDPTMISFTQIFAQQPRNTPNSVAVPYCQVAPKNAELNGLFQCQYQGANQKTFVGNIALGQPGTIPFGKSAALNPLGSCLAHPSGPIADGTQLTDITSNPGVSGSSKKTAVTTAAAKTTAKATAKTTAKATAKTTAKKTTVATTAIAAVATAASSSSSSTGFQKENAIEAQALNAKFATLTESSSCTDGEEACVKGSFAQCVNGAFVLTSCGTLQCAALPLVEKPGTSITCDTTADAIARIEAAGGSDSLTGDGSTAAADIDTSATSSSSKSSTSSTKSSSSSTSFQALNGKDAQALNAKFATLTESSSCTDGEEACVKGEFAQCVNGSFVLTSCGTLTCAALPLVNSRGTSITCDTPADALARIHASGVTGSLTG